MGIPLVIATETGMIRRMLRRYRGGTEYTCPGGSYHDAQVVIDELPVSEKVDASGDNWPHDDARWPKTCDTCSYVFVNEDHWQRNDCRVYRHPTAGDFIWWGNVGKQAPPGTMVRAEWYDHFAGDRGDSWLVVLPDGGTWISTQAATGGGYWNVTGTPPNITATPSIWHNSPNGWHGFITNGELVGV